MKLELAKDANDTTMHACVSNVMNALNKCPQIVDYPRIQVKSFERDDIGRIVKINAACNLRINL